MGTVSFGGAGRGSSRCARGSWRWRRWMGWTWVEPSWVIMLVGAWSWAGVGRALMLVGAGGGAMVGRDVGLAVVLVGVGGGAS